MADCQGWRSEFLYLADAATFTACVNGLRWPVAMAEGYFANALVATPVLTTASDARQTLAVFLPANLHCFTRLEDVDPDRFAAVLWISARALPVDYAARLAGKRIIYRPGSSA